MYVVMGATGNVGRNIVEGLLAPGKKVRAIGRNAEKLQPLVDKGAEAAVGDVTDAAFLKKAFEGAQAVFFMIPPNFQVESFRAYQTKIIDNGIAAAKGAGVKYVVTLSSQGAHLPKGNGPVAGLYEMEHKFGELEGVNVLHLRPTFFMENTLMYVDMIKNMGLIGSNVKGDAKLSMVATKDIGEAATRALLALDFAGVSRKDLLGQRDLTMNEVARLLGAAIGKPDIAYVEFSPDEVKKGMLGMGLPEELAGAFVELNERVNDGRLLGAASRAPENTTATPFEEFAHTFAAVYSA